MDLSSPILTPTASHSIQMVLTPFDNEMKMNYLEIGSVKNLGKNLSKSCIKFH